MICRRSIALVTIAILFTGCNPTTTTMKEVEPIVLEEEVDVITMPTYIQEVTAEAIEEEVEIVESIDITDGAEPVFMNVSAYTLAADECGKDVDDPYYGITASGEYVQEWYTVAAAKSVPFGTRIYIPYFKDAPNEGIFVVQDRGGAIKDGKLDVYMVNRSDALSFGRRDLEVYILPNE